MTARQLITITIAIVVAASLQAIVAVHIALKFARPDFLLIAIVCAALLTSTTGGIITGFVGGLFMSVLTGINYGTFLLTRVIAGWTAGLVGKSLHVGSLATVFVAVVAATFTTQVLAFVLAPASAPRDWGLNLLGEMAYNALLIAPVYRLLERIISPPQKETFYIPHSHRG